MLKNLTPMVKKITIINIIVFILTFSLGLITGIPIERTLALYPIDSEVFRPYQFVSCMFAHSGLAHIGFNLLLLMTIGPQVEEVIGSKKFILFYFIIGLFASICQLCFVEQGILGASGAIFGIMIMFALYFPDNKTNLVILPFTLKTRNVIFFITLGELFMILTNPNDGVGHWAHLGGAIAGFILFKYNQKLQPNI